VQSSWSVFGVTGSQNAIIAPTFGCAFPSRWPPVIACPDDANASAPATAAKTPTRFLTRQS